MLTTFSWKDGIAWETKLHGGSIPREFIPSIEYGIRLAAKTGVLSGFPMINIKVTLLDGSYHAKDSNPLSFELAGQIAFKNAVRLAGPTLLEPIMKVAITTPKDFLGNVAGDLNRRRGLIVDSSERDNATMIEAHVPLSEMFGYTTELRSMSTGRAASAMEPLRYAEVPAGVRKQVLEENA